MTTLHKIKLNCHVVGFDIGCVMNIFVTSTTVVLI